MKDMKVVDFDLYRSKKIKIKRKRDQLNKGKKGRVFGRGGKVWFDFTYLGHRVRVPTEFGDTPANRKKARALLDLIVAEIATGRFKFAERFPNYKKRDRFTKLEGRVVKKEPKDVNIGDYIEQWLNKMKSGMSENQIRDYSSIIEYHLKPYFSDFSFADLSDLMEDFELHLRNRKNRYGNKLSPKRIQNIFIPLRKIVKSAFKKYKWKDLDDPFEDLELPKAKKRIRIFPFSYDEWKIFMQQLPPWYRPYFGFAVQTGLRPSEQVALKWSAIDGEYIYIELSRVRNREKEDLKTEESRRSIAIRPAMANTLEQQKLMTARFDSPYVFLNTFGRPILQDKMRELYSRVMKKSGLRYRRMYEIRHTFASWALAAGETPGWVAKTLGHVDTSMVYKTYGRYIPNLTRQDGSAFERQFVEGINQEDDLK